MKKKFKFAKLRGGNLGSSVAYTKARRASVAAVKAAAPRVIRGVAKRLVQGGVITPGTLASMGTTAIASMLVGRIIDGVSSGIYRSYGKLPEGPVKMPKMPGRTGGPSSLPKDAKIVPTEQGMGAIVGQRDADSVDYQNIRTYRVTDTFHDGDKSASLILARKLYKSTTVTYYSTEKNANSKLYAYSGLNCKGIVYPFQAMPGAIAYLDIDQVSDSNTTSPLNNTAGMFGESSIDRALMLQRSLLANANTGILTEMPPLAAGDIDYYFPIQSWESKIRMTNTNRYLPLDLKVYLVQCITDTSLGPVDVWYPRLAAANDSERMNFQYVTPAPTDESVPQAGGGVTTVRTGSYIHPQATPGMSTKFKKTYKILKVRSMHLKASETLEYTIKRHYSKPMSAQTYNEGARRGFSRHVGDLDVMIEFQGKRVAYFKTNATATQEYSSVAHCGFAKLRYTVEKKFTHSFPISSGLGLYNPASSTYTPSFIGTKQMPLVLYSDTAAYSSLSTNTATLVANTYYVPIVTDNTTQYAGPLIVDPI